MEDNVRSAGGPGAASTTETAQDRRAWAEPLLAGVVVSLIAEAKDAGWSGRLEYVVELCVQEMTSTLGMSREEVIETLLRWAGELGEDLTREDVEKAIAA
jgi:hypothetical protein